MISLTYCLYDKFRSKKNRRLRLGQSVDLYGYMAKALNIINKMDSAKMAREKITSDVGVGDNSGNITEWVSDIWMFMQLE